jgi:uncharacterized protein
MNAYVYRSARQPDTYVYLATRDGFDCLPAPLRERLGALTFALELELAPGRKLAREDAGVVRANLAAHGFHLQLPPPPDGSLRATLRG